MDDFVPSGNLAGHFLDDATRYGVVIVLIGGPADGREMAVPEVRNQYLWPRHPPLTWAPDPYPVEPTLHEWYRLELDHGWPSIDDRGRYRYRYMGVT